MLKTTYICRTVLVWVFFIYEELQIVWAIFMQSSQLLLSRNTFPEILCHIIKSECIRDETWSTKPHFSLLVSASSFEQDFTINTYLCNNLDSSTLPHLTFGMWIYTLLQVNLQPKHQHGWICSQIFLTCYFNLVISQVKMFCWK